MSATSTNSTNPFQISIAENEQMKCHDVLLQVGGLKDKEQAQRFADAIADWLTSESGWKARVQ